MTNKNNSSWLFAGVGAVALAAVLGITHRQWMPPAPATLVAAQPAEAVAAAVAPAASRTTVAPAEIAPSADTTISKTAAATAIAAPPAVSPPVVSPPAAAAPQPAPVQKPPAPAQQVASAEPLPAAAQQVASAEPPPTVESPAPKPAPTFDTVRVNKTGEAVIAGRAEPGAQVAVKLGDRVVGTAVAAADGTFVVVPEAPLPAGNGALSLEETMNGSLVPAKSEQIVAVLVPEQAKSAPVVAVLSPDAPTKILQQPAETAAAPAATTPAATTPAVAAPAVAAPAGLAPLVATLWTTAPSATAPPAATAAPVAAAPAATPVKSAGLSLDAVDYDSAGNIVFSGRFAPGATARVYVDNKLAGEAKAGEDSRWNFAGASQIISGVHSLRVDGLDANGAVVARLEAPFFREDSQKVASATISDAPAITAAQPPASTTTQATAAPPPAAAAPSQPVAAPAQQTASAPAQQPASAEPASPQPRNGRVVIQPGNNLWRIATVIYGAGTKYTVLYGANKELIRNPNLIYPGQVFTTPDVVPPEQIDPHQHTPPQPAAGSAQ